MAWPTDLGATGELISAAQFNRLPMLLADTTVAGSVAASIDFTSIPAHWSHLRIDVCARGDTAATSVNLLVRFNADSTGQYDYQYIRVQNATVDGSASLAQTAIITGDVPAASAPASSFGPCVIDISDYADGSNHQVLLFQTFRKRDTAAGDLGYIAGGGLWRITTAVSRVTLSPAAGNFAIGSRASLYGMGRV
ncbi:MAG: hypothetical protein NUW01_13840 [Gemmatimonadaceae bacterium]|nr:hypothetical protein [Gemmatimonadaceae bacterium]